MIRVGVMRTPSTGWRLAGALGVALGLALASCGAGDALPPETGLDEREAAASCPPVDAYLADLYALVDAGEAAQLARVVREAFPEDVRRDLVEALLRLLGGLERGALGRLADAAEASPEAASAAGTDDLQPRLGRVVAWLVRPTPRSDALRLAQRVVATCEGGPPLKLLARLLEDEALVGGLRDLLTSATLGDTLRTLAREASEGTATGREATAALVRNLLLAATQPSFRVETVTGLLGLLVDLEDPSSAALVDGLTRLLDAEGLPVAQALLACLHRADPERVLGATLYDLLTSGILVREAAEAATPDTGADAVFDGLREAARQLLDRLGQDGLARRGLAAALDILLAPEHAGPALDDLATLLEASGFDGVLDLLLDVVSGRCLRCPGCGPSGLSSGSAPGSSGSTPGSAAP
jgi:hypothetical protein